MTLNPKVRPHRQGLRIFYLDPLSVLVFALLIAVSSEPSQAEAPSPLDFRISRAVETELKTDSSLSTPLVDVQTQNGVVTLTGTVNNLLAKEKAVHLAKTVRGVKAVVDRLNVRPVERPDDGIQRDVIDAFIADPAVDYYDEINVEVRDGVVTLEGAVESQPEKFLAVKVAKGVKGVKRVKNNLDIDPRPRRPDREIERDIKNRLDFNIWINNDRIQVQVQDGRVTLTGKVGSALEKERAEYLAWVNGVQSVEAGGLEVDPGKEDKNRRQSPLTLQTDEEIQQAIQTAFQYDPRVENFHPKVQVDDGVVTLTGAVGNLQAKKAAESDARNTVGVRRVKNYLRVRPPQTWTDAEIRENLKKAFARNPNLEKKKIGVVVRNQQVTLAGAVDSYYEKGLAEETASKVKGVVEVDNHLVVRDYARVYSRFSYYTDPDLAFFLWSNKTDQEIRDDIKDQFFWNPFIDSDAISVSVDHGVVTLKGWVEDWTERDAAIKNAYQGGAREVIDKMRLESRPPRG